MEELDNNIEIGIKSEAIKQNKYSRDTCFLTTINIKGPSDILNQIMKRWEDIQNIYDPEFVDEEGNDIQTIAHWLNEYGREDFDTAYNVSDDNDYITKCEEAGGIKSIEIDESHKQLTIIIFSRETYNDKMVRDYFLNEIILSKNNSLKNNLKINAEMTENEEKMTAIEGWDASRELAEQTKTAAVALRKIGDGSPNEEEEKDYFDNCLIVLHSQNGSWKALYGYSWEEIEDFISTNPEYDEIYYSQEEMDWSDETYDLFDSYMENSGNDTPWQVVVEEAINDTKEEYKGPCFPVDLIYFGKIILTVEAG